MLGKVTVVLLLTTCLSSFAVAAEEATHETPEKARKLDAYLDTIGVNNPNIRSIINKLQERKEGRYLRIAEEPLESGRIVLHYQMKPKIGIKQLELKYQSDDRKSEVVVSTKAVMYNYKWNF